MDAAHPDDHALVLGLGSNLGDRIGQLGRAARAVGRLTGVRVVAWSRVYESAPWGVTDQPRFLNAALRIETEVAPGSLREQLAALEQQLGREPGPRWGPRAIDLDLLAWGQRVIESQALVVPHLRLAERAFALQPLADVAPGWHHPQLGRTAAELLGGLLDGARSLDQLVAWPVSEFDDARAWANHAATGG